jgi:hypothetical protein
MKHTLMIVVGCSLALLLIFLLPFLGLGGGWMVAVAFGALMYCHLMHYRMYKAEMEGENDHEHCP